MVSAVRTHPCRQLSYTKQKQVLTEEEEKEEEEEEGNAVLAPPIIEISVHTPQISLKKHSGAYRPYNHLLGAHS